MHNNKVLKVNSKYIMCIRFCFFSNNCPYCSCTCFFYKCIHIFYYRVHAIVIISK